MPYFDQDNFDVRCEWGVAAVRHMAPPDVIIVVDVLSFTTSVVVAVARGAVIFPCRWQDPSAVAYAEERKAELATGRRRHERRYCLAPSSLETIPAGLRLVLPSPNGSSIAFQAMSVGATVLAGSLRNASAVARWANSLGHRITVVPAGERWPDGSLRPAIEDWIGAGAIIRSLTGCRSPEARMAAASFEAAAGDLLESLSRSSSGRELIDRGFERDIRLSAELDTTDCVPILDGDAFVSASPNHRRPLTGDAPDGK